MTNIIKFLYRNNFIRASDGYLYGKCSRLWYFANQTGFIRYTDQDLEYMKSGSEIHKKIQQKFKDAYSYEIEKDFERDFIFNNKLFHLTCRLDLFKNNIFIKIKPKWSFMAYVQTLLQKIVIPDMKVYIFEYGAKDYFPIKSNIHMAKVYLLRILLARDHLTPIPPSLHIEHKYCKSCLFKDKCYGNKREMEILTWKSFTQQTKRIESTLSI